MRRHMEICHDKDGEFNCTICGMIADSEDNLRRHMKNEHRNETVRSRVVCRHWKRGNCWKGNGCMFSHVGSQVKSNSTQGATNCVS